MKKILLFDDEQDILDVTRIILSAEYEVHTRDNVLNLENIVIDIMPDLIFMDLRIPKTGGREGALLLKANAKTKDIPLLFFSANNDVSIICKEVGAQGYIAKPYKMEELKDKVAKILKLHK